MLLFPYRLEILDLLCHVCLVTFSIFFFFLHVFVLAVTAVFNHRFACPSGRSSVPSPSHSYPSLSFKLKNVLFFCASAAAESQHERDGEAVHPGPC